MQAWIAAALPLEKLAEKLKPEADPPPAADPPPPTAPAGYVPASPSGTPPPVAAPVTNPFDQLTAEFEEEIDT